MIAKAEHFIFYLIVLFLPTQLGKHFWPDFSKISGIRIDYLSPTIYFTDVLIVILFVLWIFRNRIFNKRINIFKYRYLLLLGLLAIFHQISSLSPGANFYGWIKVIEFLFFGYYISKQGLVILVNALSNLLFISALVVASLGLVQLIIQSSVGGLFYFLGERTISLSTLGIATLSVDSTSILRPYSTFSHPNVFAFYLLFVNSFVLYNLLEGKQSKEHKFFLICLLIFFSSVLFLTFSRLTIIIYLIYLSLLLYKLISKKIIILLLLIPSLITYFIFFKERFFDTALLLKDIVLRVKLNETASQIISNNLYFGVGLKNYFIHALGYEKELNSLYLQPVHNIFLLLLSEVGLVGTIIVLLFMVKTIIRLRKQIRKSNNLSSKNYYRTIFFLIIAVFLIGLFDHLFLTIQQGQLMLALLLGLAWANFSQKLKRA